MIYPYGFSPYSRQPAPIEPLRVNGLFICLADFLKIRFGVFQEDYVGVLVMHIVQIHTFTDAA